MSDRIVFGILTARESPAVARQLVDALGPSHPVIIHHDFGKQPDFTVDGSNVHIIQDYVDTAWGTWSLVGAIGQLIRVALRRHTFDYFQLLSGTCMPLRPIAEFESFVGRAAAEVNMDLCNLIHDPLARLSHGFRAYAPRGSFRFRLLCRAREWYVKGRLQTVQHNSLGMWKRMAEPDGRPLPLRARAALRIMAVAERGVLFRHPFRRGFEPYIGSMWFGCTAGVCRYIVARRDDDALERHCQRVLVPDEMYFATLIGNSGFRVGPSNHAVSDFEGSHPRWIDRQTLIPLRATGRFFARKFPDDPDAPARIELRRVLDRRGRPPAPPAPG